MLYVTFFFTVTLAVYVVFVLREERSARLKRRLARVTGMPAEPEAAVSAAESSGSDGGAERSLRGRVLRPLWRAFRKGFRRSMQGRDLARIELKLLQAGRPMNLSPVDYRMLQLTLLVAGPGLFGFYSILLKAGALVTLLLILVGFALALALPGYYLRIKTRQRARLALRELPDVLDLMTVSLEAGLGFDSALSKLISRKQGVLASEFQRCLEEIRLGKTRREALSGVKERLLLDEIRVLIGSILQAEKLGIGMVQVLRIQSQEVREQRKQRAEEEAMKAPIKMLFPLVLFIFPSLFIVLLGPAVIQFVQAFMK